MLTDGARHRHHARAQERFGGIAGTVTGAHARPAQQGAVPGATITASNNSSGTSRTVVSNADGGYRIADLEPRRYSVSVELQRFQKVEADDVIVLLGRTVEFTAVLNVGSASEVVSVSVETTRQIDVRTVTQAHNVTAKELRRIPTASSFQALALVAPASTRARSRAVSRCTARADRRTRSSSTVFRPRA